METLLQDLRCGLRMLAKSPGFTAIALLTLALGIGANTALFSVVNGVLLNPLAYPQSGQLVALYGKTPGFDQAPINYPNFLDWQRDTQTFSSMAIYRNQDYNFTGTGQAARLSGYMISADFFSTLGVRPILGRTFRADDDVVGAAPVVILGGGFWKRKFGSSLEITGRSALEVDPLFFPDNRECRFLSRVAKSARPSSLRVAADNATNNHHRLEYKRSIAKTWAKVLVFRLKAELCTRQSCF